MSAAAGVVTERHPASAYGDGEVDIAVLAAAIADESSRVTISSCCARVTSGPHDWFDLGTCCLQDWHHVDRAATYLDRRGALAAAPMIRSTAFPSLVRFEEPALSKTSSVDGCRVSETWAGQR